MYGRPLLMTPENIRKILFKSVVLKPITHFFFMLSVLGKERNGYQFTCACHHQPEIVCLFLYINHF